MDHHCPWINTCVGWGNHAHFTSFLFFATLGCAHASLMLGCSLYKSIHRTHYLQFVPREETTVCSGLYGMVFCIFTLALAIGVVIAVGMLLYCQVITFISNR